MRPFNGRFAEFWSELGDIEQIAIWNEYAYSIGDEPICDMGEFNEIASGMQPFDIALKIRFGDFNPNHNYFRFDGYANLESTDYPVEEWLDGMEDDLADFYEDHEDLLTAICSEAEELYKEEEEDEETEEEDI